MVKKIIILLGVSFLGAVAAARQETKVINYPAVVAEIPFNPQTLTCLRSRDPQSWNFDFLVLKVPPLPSVRGFEKGLTLRNNIDLNFDPSCEGMDVVGAFQRLGGKIKVSIQYSTTVQWLGGYGLRCRKIVTNSIFFNLNPIFDDWVSYSRSHTEIEVPAQNCD